MLAIYYPKLKRLTYWEKNGTRIYQCHEQDVPTLTRARAILREAIIRTEMVQELEVFP